ncbi:MAG: DNA mismatch repair protein MutL, partial [Moritella dasanensis]
ELTIRFQQLIIKKVPPYLRESQLAIVIPELLQWLQLEQPIDSAIVAWLAQQSLSQFEPAPALWQRFCSLDEETKQICYDQEHILPWHNWMKDY